MDINVKPLEEVESLPVASYGVALFIVYRS